MSWVAYQYGRIKAKEVSGALRDRGILPVVWAARPITGSIAIDAMEKHQAEAFIAEAETYTDWDEVATTFRNRYPNTPAAIATNFGGLIVKDPTGVTIIEASKARAKPLVDAGFHCLTEAYLPDSASLSPERLEYIAHAQLGFPLATIQPIFGVYGGVSLADYSAWIHLPAWSVWTMESLVANG